MRWRCVSFAAPGLVDLCFWGPGLRPFGRVGSRCGLYSFAGLRLRSGQALGDWDFSFSHFVPTRLHFSTTRAKVKIPTLSLQNTQGQGRAPSGRQETVARHWALEFLVLPDFAEILSRPLS
jgi:hypothetical protein